VILAVPIADSAEEGDERKQAFFESRIRPVLVDKCLGCHSVEADSRGKLKGGLYLDTREGLLTGGDSGPAIVAGKPAESLLVEAMLSLVLESMIRFSHGFMISPARRPNPAPPREVPS
jgi:hypothetical protein